MCVWKPKLHRGWQHILVFLFFLEASSGCLDLFVLSSIFSLYHKSNDIETKRVGPWFFACVNKSVPSLVRNKKRIETAGSGIPSRLSWTTIIVLSFDGGDMLRLLSRGMAPHGCPRIRRKTKEYWHIIKLGNHICQIRHLRWNRWFWTDIRIRLG